MDKHKLKNEPFYFNNKRSEALDNALHILLDVFDEYSMKNELTDEQVSSFKNLILNIYKEKRAVYFMEDKLSYLNERLSSAFQIALNGSFNNNNNKEDFTKVFYYNNKHKFVSNEQY